MTERSVGDAIENALQPLVGLPLRESNRIVDLQAFGFGDFVSTSGERPSASKRFTRRPKVPEYALHVQCRWRIIRDGSILVGAADIFWPPSGSEVTYREFDYDGVRSRRDELIDSFLTHGVDAHVVRRVGGASTADAWIEFADRCVLELWPDHRTGADADGPDEYWRFFRDRENHFVVEPDGVQLI